MNDMIQFEGIRLPIHRDRNVEIANLEDRVVETAVSYVQGVGFDGGSLQQEHDAVKRFVDNHNAFMEATRALIAAREKESLHNP